MLWLREMGWVALASCRKSRWEVKDESIMKDDKEG